MEPIKIARNRIEMRKNSGIADNRRGSDKNKDCHGGHGGPESTGKSSKTDPPARTGIRFAKPPLPFMLSSVFSANPP